jgi:Ca-activated chloride channel family protein
MNKLFDKTPRYLIALCLALLLLWHTSAGTHGQSQSPATPSAPAQSSGNEPLVLTVTVKDKKGEPIPGLPQSAFTVFDDNVPREIIAFNHGDEPLSLGIVIDFNNSREDYRRILSVISTSLQSFIQRSHSSNDYFIVGRRNREDIQEVLLDWTSGPESLKLVLEQLPQDKLRGTNALYDLVDYSIEKLKGGRHSKRVLLLVSFGGERWSQISRDELYRHLNNSPALIYALDLSGMVIHESPSAVDTNNSGARAPASLSFDALDGRQNLKEITSRTGGRMFSKLDPVEIKKALERMALELRSQYSLTIKPTNNKGPEKWHTLKVRVKASSNQQGEQKSISVRSREGYYAGSK